MHQDNRSSKQSIHFNGYRFMVGGMSSNVDESLVNIHGRKVNQGDPGPDDHPINSTWIQSDWTGGGQVVNGSPDVVTGRFDFATAETMQAKGVTNSALRTTWTDPGGGGSSAMALGVFDDLNWAAWGTDIRWFDSATSTWTDIANNLTVAPATKGVTYQPSSGALLGTKLLVIPCTSKINYIDVAKARTEIVKTAVDIAVLGDRLFRLGSGGDLEYTTDLAAWAGTTYIPDGSAPKHLDVYLTSGGDPTIYVTTNAGVWVWDALSGELFPSQLQYPKHPDQGRASCVWRSDLYTSVGDGCHRFNRSTIAAMGLDRDDGLPDQYRGAIVDLEPSYNAIYALVNGVRETTEAAVDEYTFDAGDDYMTAPATSGYGLLMKWNGFGWHFVDRFEGTGPTTVVVSDAEDEYGVWYSEGQNIHRIKVSRTYMNLKDEPPGPVVPQSLFESSWYDFGWKGQVKVVKNLSFKMEEYGSGNTIEAFYKVDDDTNDWVALGAAQSEGEYSYYFNPDAGAAYMSSDPNDYSGTPVERIKLKFQLTRNLGHTTFRPILRWFSLSARKMLRPVRTFRTVLELNTTDGKTSQELREVLLDAIREPGSATFVYQNETIKVDLVALEFRTITEPTEITYIARINLIESNETIL